MTNGLGDNHLSYDVTVNAAAARKELDGFLAKIRTTAAGAVKAGTTIDSSALEMAKSYAVLSRQLDVIIEQEASIIAAGAAARAAVSRADLAGTNASTAAGIAPSKIATAEANAKLAAMRLQTEEARALAIIDEQANKNSLAANRIQTIQEQREERLIAKQEAAEAKAAAARERARAQQDSMWGAREKEQLAEVRNNERLRAQTDSMWATREKQIAAETAAVNKQAAAEIKGFQQQEAIERKLDAQQMKRYQPQSIQNINATRYALYDVARTAGTVGLVLTGIGLGAVYVASKFDAAFSDVQRTTRTTGADAEHLKDQLLDLSTSIPVSFTDITKVASLGAQLGIDAQNIAGFTKTVTEFSAVTNASTDTAATAFGRISNLLNVPASEFDKLGSAIAEVGVKSVATETEILTMSQQIAGAAAAYNFTADQVVGLSGALASLAIKPEAARGSITRVFGNIEKAVVGASGKIGEYSRILGTTDDIAEKLWRSDPSAFFQQLIGGLSRSKNLLADLQSIGASTNVRDINLFQRLAKNPELLNKALDDSAQSYAKGTYLAEAYAIKTDTVAAKVKMLSNSFLALAASVGGILTPVLKPALDILNWIIKALNSNRIGLSLAVALAVLVGGFLLVKGATAAAIAGLLALQSVLKNMPRDVYAAGISFSTLNKVMRETGRMAGITAPSVGGVTKAVKGFGSALIGIGKGTVVLAAITAAFWALDQGVQFVQNSMKSSAEHTEDYLGSLAGLTAAMKQDSLPGAGKAIASFTSKLPAQIEQQDQTAVSANNLARMLGKVGDASETSSNKAVQASLNFGNASKNYVKDQLAKSDEFKKAAGDSDFVKYWQAVGANVDDAIKAAAKNGKKGVKDYFAELQKEAVKNGKLKQDGPNGLTKFLDGSYINSNDATPRALTSGSLSSFIDGLSGVEEKAQQATDLLTNSNTLLGKSAVTTGAQIEDQSRKITLTQQNLTDLQKALTSAFSGPQIAGQWATAIDSLNQGLAEGGHSFSAFTEAGRTNLTNLQGTIMATANYATSMGENANEALVPIFMNLQEQGVDTTSLLHTLAADPLIFKAGIDITQVVNGINAVKTGSAIASPFQSLLAADLHKSQGAAQKNAAAMKEAAAGTAAVTKEVRTLLDYAGDVGTAFKRAFDIRFASGSALDGITSKWRDLHDAQKKARDDLKGYMADLLKLKADRGILEFQLSVAEQYGNTLRANEIRASLAQNAVDTTAKQGDISTAKGAASTVTTGSSAAAIANRKALQDLSSSYDDYIQRLIESGASQATVNAAVSRSKKEFENQANALGFTDKQLKPYLAHFGDLATILRKIPKNITVTANANPAQQAINEFFAKNTNGKGASKGVSVPLKATWDDGGLKKYARGEVIATQIANWQDAMNRALDHGVSPAPYAKQIKKLTAQLQSGHYAHGGFVPWGRGGGGDNGTGFLPGGRTVGLQGGEPIINNKARSKYGDQMFDQINAMTFQPRSAPIVIQSGGGGETRLDMYTIKALAAMLSPGDVLIDGKKAGAIIGSANAVVGGRGVGRRR